MNKGPIWEYLTHPVFISLIIWGILIIFIPPFFSKYKFKRIADEHCQPNTYFYYYDLDNDDNSELISVDLNDDLQSKIIVKKNNRILDQYDLNYQPLSGYHVYTDDYDKDGFCECYVFTMSSDSIFLNIFDPVKSRKMLLADRFIDFRLKAPNSEEFPKIVPVGMADGLTSRNRDLIFYINTGYIKQPRNLYRYIISEDSLIKSPKSGDALLGCIIYDLNRDNSPEFLISASATGNMNESFPYSDHYSWMMVLDKNLNFYFPPLKIVEKPSNIQLVPVNLGKQNGFVLFSDYYGTGNFVPSFFLFDQNGNILKKKPAGLIESTFSRIIPNEANNFRTFFFLINRNEVAEIDGSLNVLKTVKIPDIANPEFPLVVDADLDGKMEYILRSISKKNLIVFQHDFKFPVSAEVEKKMIEDYSITQVLKKGSKPLLYVQQRDFGSYYRYEKNVLYYFKYPLFFLLYLLIFIFIYLLSRAQRYRLNIKQQTERKIAVLQMRSIKNQIDPHFTLNILNAIGSLYATEENRDKADYIFGKYAKLIRQTVISSDQIVVTLSEEIDFVRNFIDLEKFRSDYSFKSIIDIKGDIDLQITIPRMLIYTFVENGIKYGIRNKHEGGLLRIEVYLENNKCVITVEDNGPGLQKSDISVHNTGKGLIIVNELIELYYKLEKVKITCSLENIRDKNDCIAGTKAKIIIPLKTPRNS